LQLDRCLAPAVRVHIEQSTSSDPTQTTWPHAFSPQFLAPRSHHQILRLARANTDEISPYPRHGNTRIFALTHSITWRRHIRYKPPKSIARCRPPFINRCIHRKIEIAFDLFGPAIVDPAAKSAVQLKQILQNPDGITAPSSFSRNFQFAHSDHSAWPADKSDRYCAAAGIIHPDIDPILKLLPFFQEDAGHAAEACFTVGESHKQSSLGVSNALL
jgi:hypothetical protein